ncbi:MAG: hypothetical protein H6R17_1648 [Proteobacteria bacterium]|nr:hypothetical protein [Pseudomonadota bacterium]
MAKNALVGLLMLVSTVLVSASVFADEPSLHQVYQAAEAGKLTEAQTMMHEVLSTHPNSGKAHFVEAELLVKQGQLAKAEAELATAERFAPGLPFAKPQAVQNLRAQLGSSRSTRTVETQQFQPLPQTAHESSLPWGMLMLGAGLIAFIVFAARFMAQRNASPASSGGASPGFGAASGGSPLPPYAGGGAGTIATPGSGMGSRLMGGLATGAAVGAGMVAGEALMHRFMDGREHPLNSPLGSDLGPSLPDDGRLDDMGGSDFGVADSSSWDDSSSGDWN